jgi:hypothetical protein
MPILSSIGGYHEDLQNATENLVTALLCCTTCQQIRLGFHDCGTYSRFLNRVSCTLKVTIALAA